MIGSEYFLANLWIGLIAFFLLSYAISDGADIGIGIMSLLVHGEREHTIMIGAIESTWHTNQTWLVIVGGMVFGAFPFFYSVVFSSLYVPVMAMLFSLILRGVALDYHAHAKNKPLSTWIFAVGSLLVALTQGFALGGLLGGIHVVNGHFAGSFWDWANPFSFLVALGVVIGDLVLGASFLILKADGRLQALGYRWAWIGSALLVPISVGVYVWMYIKYPHMVDKFTTPPDMYWVVGLPCLAAVSGMVFLLSLWKRWVNVPFLSLGAMILFSFTGIALALYPYMIPNVVTTAVQITEAAASKSTLIFMSLVMAAVLPVILIYNAYNQFWVFRGKIKDYLEEIEKDSK